MLSSEMDNNPNVKEVLVTPPIAVKTQSRPIIVQATETNNEEFPDLNGIKSTVLVRGPRVCKEVKYTKILNRHTGEVHHYALTLQTLRNKKGEWGYDEKNTITLSSEGDDEIQKLIDFLTVVRGEIVPEETSGYLVVPTAENADYHQVIRENLVNLSAIGKGEVIAEVLALAATDSQLLDVLLERAEGAPQLFSGAAAALNLATYRVAVEKLTKLIQSSERVSEATFQNHLTENPWMFGSEYSELLDRRRWTRDEIQDFVVRRTTDGFVELIEIKTPLTGKSLFLYDTSHKSYYPSAELSKVIGQVQNYIEKLDADRHAIKANDDEDTCKIRAKIIIGRDEDIEQIKALRRLNSHLHRIEIITFDQLQRIAERVLGYLEKVLSPEQAQT